jgi:large subunit ribosomal protein L4e
VRYMAEKEIKKTKKVKKKPRAPAKKAKPSKPEKVNLYSIDGKSQKKIVLPKVFNEDVRTDLIRRAVTASRANRRQPYGPNPGSGMSHASSTWGKGRGVSRVKRMTQGRTGVESPGNVGGRRAHPPRPEKNWSKKVNKKERRRARNSALSATAEPDMIVKRGHKFKKKMTVPLIVENSIEKIETTKKALKALKRLGVMDDLERARAGTHIRAGRGTMRGRRYKSPKSLLIIVKDTEKAKRGFGNLTGVDITTPNQLNPELLAPGGMPGRLTMISEGALKQLEVW